MQPRRVADSSGGCARLPLDRVTDVGVLAVAAPAVGSAPAAVIGPLALWAGGQLTGDVWRAAVAWWLGDAAGVLVLAAVLCRAGRTAPPRHRVGRRGNGWRRVGRTRGIRGHCGRVYRRTGCFRFRRPLPAAAPGRSGVRFGPRGAALANLFTAAVVIGIVIVAGGPISTSSSSSSSLYVTHGPVAGGDHRENGTRRWCGDGRGHHRTGAAEPARPTRKPRSLPTGRLFAALLEHYQDAIVVVTPEGHTAYVSDAITHLTGRTPGELAGRPAFEHVRRTTWLSSGKPSTTV